MLKRIEVENFKSLKHLDYPCAKLNLLMGINGAGKSSFVQLMLLMRNLARQKLQASNALDVDGAFGVGCYEDLRYCYADVADQVEFKALFTPRVTDAVCRHGDKLDLDALYMMFPLNPSESEVAPDTIFSIERVLSKGNNCRVLCHDLEYVNAVLSSSEYKKMMEYRGKFGVEMVDSNGEPTQYSDIYHAFMKKRDELSAKYDAFASKAGPYFRLLWRNMKIVDAFRRRPSQVHSGGRHDKGEWLSRNVGFCPEGDDVIEFLWNVGAEVVLDENNPMLFPNSRSERSLIDQVNAWLQVVSPGADIQIDRKTVAQSEKFVQSVAFGHGSSERSYKPQNVGFGISYVLPVLVALLSSVPEDIVIIENPEAHLHPRGQAEMGNLIARAAAYGIQVFVETHSDHVINGVRVAAKKCIINPEDVNIAFFERKEHVVMAYDGTKHKEYYADVRNIKIDHKGSLSEYPEDFMDEWNNQLMRLMKPRKK